MEKRWLQREPDQHIVDTLHKGLGIHPILCRLLALRNITTYQEAFEFFRPSLSGLHDPFLMKDMDKAVARITQAMEKGKKSSSMVIMMLMALPP